MAHCGCGIVLLLMNVLLVEAAYNFKNCGGPNRIATLSEFRILPDPLDMKENLTMTVRGELLSEIPPEAKLEIKQSMVNDVFGMQVETPIPCLMGMYGSCTFDLCDYMKRFKAQLCPLLGDGDDCTCPPKPRRYVRENMHIEVNKAFGRLVPKGKYRTEVRVKDSKKNTELICLKFFTNVK